MQKFNQFILRHYTAFKCLIGAAIVAMFVHDFQIDYTSPGVIFSFVYWAAFMGLIFMFARSMNANRAAGRRLLAWPTWGWIIGYIFVISPAEVVGERLLNIDLSSSLSHQQFWPVFIFACIMMLPKQMPSGNQGSETKPDTTQNGEKK